MFSKKNPCANCNSKVNEKYDFCPHCGRSMKNPEKEQKDFGLLGKDENIGMPVIGGGNMGMTDRMLDSIMKSLMRSLDKQLQGEGMHVQNLPNGINIKLGVPVRKIQKKQSIKPKITDEQLKRMTGMPRVEAKSNVRRLGDKVVYELKTNGIQSVEDVFISKLESGYEVKAIGNKKVYVNSLPVNLPLRGYSIDEAGLKLEFATS